METPAACQPEPILWKNEPNLGLPCTYVLKKPKQIKKSISQPSYGESYRGRSAGPRSRVSPEKDHRSLEIPGKRACGPTICVEVWWKVADGLSRIPGVTLIADMRKHLVKSWTCRWKLPLRVNRSQFFVKMGPTLVFHVHMA